MTRREEIDPPIDGPQNRQALKELARALTAGDVMALVGSGCSIRVGYPSWQQLLRRMEQEARSEYPGATAELDAIRDDDDLLWCAEEYRQLMGEDRFHALLRDCFGKYPAPCDRFHRMLIRLRFSHFLTTNYDAVLESAHTEVFGTLPNVLKWDSPNIAHFITRAHDPSFGKHFVYLHGRFDDPSNMILTESAYRERYVLTDKHTDRLFALLATSRVCCIGFSMADLDLMGLFRHIKAHMGPSEPRHFCLLPAPERKRRPGTRRKLSRKYGIQAIFYALDKDPDPHRALVEIVEHLGASRPDRAFVTSPESEPEQFDEWDDPA